MNKYTPFSFKRDTEVWKTLQNQDSCRSIDLWNNMDHYTTFQMVKDNRFQIQRHAGAGSKSQVVILLHF